MFKKGYKHAMFHIIPFFLLCNNTLLFYSSSLIKRYFTVHHNSFKDSFIRIIVKIINAKNTKSFYSMIISKLHRLDRIKMHFVMKVCRKLYKTIWSQCLKWNSKTILCNLIFQDKYYRKLYWLLWKIYQCNDFNHYS